MLNYGIVERKREIEFNTPDGKTTRCKDLLDKSFRKELKLSDLEPVIVNEYYEARPDLLSLAMYGNDMYGDVICKVNGISNPFELARDTIILMPTSDYCRAVLMHGDGPQDMVDNSENFYDTGQYTKNGFPCGSSKVHARGGASMTQKQAGKRLAGDEYSTSTAMRDANEIGGNRTGKKLVNERRSPAEQTVEDVNFVIDRSLGLIVY